MNLPPGVGTFEPNGGSASVGQWVRFTTTYTDANGYQDIAWSFFFLDGAPPFGSGALAAAYYQPANILWLIGDSDGFCQPGQWSFPQTDHVALSCYHTTVSGEGDTLTIDWVALPKQCFEGGCGWNYAIELVEDSTGLWDAGLAGWWRLDPARGTARRTGSAATPTEADVSTELNEVLEQLREEIEAWQSQLGGCYSIQR